MSRLVRLAENDMESLLPAIEVLQGGGVIAYPTETVYGLGALMNEIAAVRRIFDIKGRDLSKALSFMLASGELVSLYATNFNGYASELMASFWPGPLTLVLHARSSVPGYAIFDGKIGLRVPDHPVTRYLCEQVKQPITTTSANRSGRPSPVVASGVMKELGMDVDLIIDGGECVGKVASTVLDATGPEPVLLRQGAIPFADIRKVAG